MSKSSSTPVIPIKMKGVRPTVTAGNIAKESIVKLRCGDCLHYKGTAHPSMGEPCYNLDVGKSAVAPSCYTPNVGVFRDDGSLAVHSLLSAIACFTPQKQRVLMGMLRNAAALERTGYSFLQCVYFATNARGKTTLSDYYRGFVAAKGPGTTLQVVGINFLNSKNTACVAFLERDSLLTKAQFDRERKRLVKLGKLEHLPARVQKQLTKGEEYEPPTLDTAEDFLQRAATSSKKHRGEVRKAQAATWTLTNRESDEEAAETSNDGL